jgi:hypothetical protein
MEDEEDLLFTRKEFAAGNIVIQEDPGNVMTDSGEESNTRYDYNSTGEDDEGDSEMEDYGAHEDGEDESFDEGIDGDEDEEDYDMD